MSERRELDALEARLRALKPAVDWPTERDISAIVRQRLERAARPVPRRGGFIPRTAFGIALVFIAVLAATLALIPATRSAIADWLGISGIEIRVQENVPTPTRTVDALSDLDLGDEVSPTEAQDAVDFTLRVPEVEDLDEPRVFLNTLPVPAVTFVYEPNSVLPVSEQTGVGMLLTQFEGRYSPDLIKKVSAGSGVRPVDIGDAGYWIGGELHSVLFRDEDGNIQEDRIRLAGNTLIWEEDGVSYRLEAEIKLREALRIARSLD